MKVESFVKFLSKRNMEFIDLMSSESALGTIDHYNVDTGTNKRTCIIISFDPPIGFPPFVLNWNRSDVWYFKNASFEDEFLEEIKKVISEVEFPYIVILEKHKFAFKRKVQRWITHFKNNIQKDIPLNSRPEFILAEYRVPLLPMVFSHITTGQKNDSLSSR